MMKPKARVEYQSPSHQLTVSSQVSEANFQSKLQQLSQNQISNKKQLICNDVHLPTYIFIVIM